MWDQLAANGNISELADQPDIALQYPLQCRIRATVVPRVQITKVILHRVYGDSKAENPPKHALVRFRNTHAIAGSNYTSSRCGTRGLVRHYTMTAHQWVGNRQKAAMRIDGPSVAETRNYANATCGNVDNTQPPMTQTDSPIDENALVIRTSVGNYVPHTFERASIDLPK